MKIQEPKVEALMVARSKRRSYDISDEIGNKLKHLNKKWEKLSGEISNRLAENKQLMLKHVSFLHTVAIVHLLFTYINFNTAEI